MNVLIVSAFDRPESFVAALHNVALGTLERSGHTVQTSSLYGEAFNPVASKIDFSVNSGAGVNYMFEQQRTVNTGRNFSPDIETEMLKLKEAELVIFHFPLWWGSTPAVLKGWFDRVLAMGFAWGPDARYEKGLMRGKHVLLTIAAGDPLSYYESDGMHRATIEQHLYPVMHHTLAYCGFDVFRPFVVASVTSAKRTVLESELARYRAFIESIERNNDFVFKF